jgi:hypothetical protein
MEEDGVSEVYGGPQRNKRRRGGPEQLGRRRHLQWQPRPERKEEAPGNLVLCSGELWRGSRGEWEASPALALLKKREGER